MKALVTPIWAVRASVVQRRAYGPLGIDRRDGTKHFLGGAKVFIIDAYFGMADSVIAIGRHRRSHRFVKMALHVRHLDSFRPALIYSPTVVSMVANHLGPSSSPTTQARAAELASLFASWRADSAQQPLRTLFEVIGATDDVVRLRNLSSPSDSAFVDVPLRLLSPEARVPSTRLQYTRWESGEVTLKQTDDAPFSGEAV